MPPTLSRNDERKTAWRILISSWIVLVYFLNPIPYSKAKAHIVSTRLWLESGNFVHAGPQHWKQEGPRAEHESELIHELGEYGYHDGDIYPKYPPGTNLLLAPFSWSVMQWGGNGDQPSRLLPDERSDDVAVNCLGAVAWSATSCAVCGLLVWQVLGLWFEPPRMRLAATALCLFGTLLFYHGTGLWTKPISGALGFLGWWLVARAALDPATSRAPTLFLAGLAAGFAVSIDYQLVVTLAVVSVYAVLRLPRRGWLTVAAGAVVPVAALATFQAVVFGHPLTPTYAFSYGHRESFGLEFPQLQALVGLTVGGTRGVIWYMPIIVLGTVGLVHQALRVPAKRWETWAALAAVVLHFVFNVSTTIWTSGPGFGPRYLVPAIPFAMLGWPAAWRLLPTWSTVPVAVWSVAVNFLGAQSYFVSMPGGIPLVGAWKTWTTSGGASTRVWRLLVERLKGNHEMPAGGLADPPGWLLWSGHAATLCLLCGLLALFWWRWPGWRTDRSGGQRTVRLLVDMEDPGPGEGDGSP